ncbi:hypothetical protein, partial [Porphyromonas endodontalis]|uniref:hypothetical protein n=1 Tax=Porphyromonas endodontalis TaxID=28124 RepID=UPI0028F16773
PRVVFVYLSVALTTGKYRVLPNNCSLNRTIKCHCIPLSGEVASLKRILHNKKYLHSYRERRYL